MAQFVPISLVKERESEQAKKRKNKLDNLNPKAAQLWDEPKKGRTLYLKQAVKDAFWMYSQSLGLSASELLERIGRGVYLLQESSTGETALPMPDGKSLKTRISLTDKAWDGFRQICRDRQIQPYPLLLWLITQQVILVGTEAES